MSKRILAAVVVLMVTAAAARAGHDSRCTAPCLGLGAKGRYPADWPLDTITDVAGVEVGHTTIIRGSDVRTGVAAILPHPSNPFGEKVPGAFFVGNAFGQLAGPTQVNDLARSKPPSCYPP